VAELVVRVGEKPDSSAIVREYPLRYKVQGRERVVGTVHVEATRAGSKFYFVPSSVRKIRLHFRPPAPRSALQHAQLRQIP
jgi:hypothetical protein